MLRHAIVWFLAFFFFLPPTGIKRTIYGHRPKTKEDTDAFVATLREIFSYSSFNILIF